MITMVDNDRTTIVSEIDQRLRDGWSFVCADVEHELLGTTEGEWPRQVVLVFSRDGDSNPLARSIARSIATPLNGTSPVTEASSRTERLASRAMLARA